MHRDPISAASDTPAHACDDACANDASPSEPSVPSLPREHRLGPDVHPLALVEPGT